MLRGNIGSPASRNALRLWMCGTCGVLSGSSRFKSMSGVQHRFLKFGKVDGLCVFSLSTLGMFFRVPSSNAPKVENKIPIDVEEYVQKLKPQLMEVVLNWLEGKRFHEIMSPGLASGLRGSRRALGVWGKGKPTGCNFTRKPKGKLRLPFGGPRFVRHAGVPQTEVSLDQERARHFETRGSPL